MTQEDFQVVSELYALLARFDPESIASASRKIHVSKNIRGALECLYKEARANDERDFSHERVTSGSKEFTKTMTKGSVYNELVAVILGQGSVFTKDKIMEVERELFSSHTISTRDSRDRAARKLVRRALNSEKTARALMELIHFKPTTQTQGWINLILKNK